MRLRRSDRRHRMLYLPCSSGDLIGKIGCDAVSPFLRPSGGREMGRDGQAHGGLNSRSANP